MIDFIRDFVHGGSVVFIGVIIILTAVALIRPGLFKTSFHEFADRKYILAASVFLCLLSGTVFVATQPTGDNDFAAEQPVPAEQTVKPMELPATLPAADVPEQGTVKGSGTAPAGDRRSVAPPPSTKATGSSDHAAPAAAANPSSNAAGHTQPAQSMVETAQPKSEKKCTQILGACL